MNQYIYVLLNPSLKGLLKIGRTNRSPEERAQELSTSTGVPQPFIVAYECIVSDGVAAEKLIHEELATEGYRINESREFFQIPLKEAVKVIDRVCQSFPQSDGFLDNEQDEEGLTAISFLELGIMHLEGTDSVLQNYVEARKCFEKAILFKEIAAYRQLADIHLWGMGVRLNTAEAIRILEEGGKKGNTGCFFILWQIFSGNTFPPIGIKIERDPSELNPTNADVAFGWYLNALTMREEAYEKKLLDEVYSEMYLRWAVSLPRTGNSLSGRYTHRLLQPRIDSSRDAALIIKAARAEGIVISALKDIHTKANISFGTMMELRELTGSGSNPVISQILNGLDIEDLKYGFSRLPTRSMLEQTRTYARYLT